LSSNKPHQLTDAYLALIAACKKNQGLTALSLISPWLNNLQSQAGIQQTAILNEALTSVDDMNLTQEINNLQQCYYGKNHQQWQGSQLLVMIQKINKQGIQSANLKNDVKHQQMLITLNP
jgi:hypothetical protein